MRFAAIEAVLPGRRLTNDEVIGDILERNAENLSASAQAMLAHAMQSLFSYAGTHVRYVRAEGETAADLTVRAGEAALRRAGLAATDIDLLIYVGVGRGFLEPATANVFQHRLGLCNATCFDVLDACASWLRAVHIARAFIRGGDYRRILILNGEFNFREYVDYRFKAVTDLRHNFAIFTIGEAATATIVEAATEDMDYYATFKTDGGLHDLCMIPLPNVAEYSSVDLPEASQPLRFFSHSRQLFEEGVNRLVRQFQADAKLNGWMPDIAFGHAASDAANDQIAIACGGSLALLYKMHGRYGNTVSASVPLAMASAVADGRLSHGSRVMIGVASAGLSTAWARFRFLCR
jgi:3-oxoacyl-[acyl-carrier-protein] synthase III